MHDLSQRTLLSSICTHPIIMGSSNSISSLNIAFKGFKCCRTSFLWKKFRFFLSSLNNSCREEEFETSRAGKQMTLPYLCISHAASCLSRCHSAVQEPVSLVAWWDRVQAVQPRRALDSGKASPRSTNDCSLAPSCLLHNPI